MKIIDTELVELKKALGKHYDEVCRFFYHALIKDGYDYKILLTRRAYVLFKIFESIFNSFPSELPDGCNEEFGVSGIILNTHSICQIPVIEKNISDAKVLIIDDIIVNGRTVTNVFSDLVKKYGAHADNVDIWSINCNNEAKCIDSVKDRFKHVIYVPQEDWKMLSDVLTRFIIVANCGYISYIKSYKYKHELSFSQFKDKIGDMIREFGEYTETVNSDINSGILFFNLKSDYDMSKYNIKTCVRFYEKSKKLIAVPYAFLPSLNADKCYGYCESLLSVFNIKVPDVFYSKDKEYAVTLYQWTIYKLSDIIMEQFCATYSLEGVFEKYFNCKESFVFCESENASGEKGEIKKQDIPPDTYVKDFATKDIASCSNILKKNLAGTNDVRSAINNYFVEMRTIDEKRAAVNKDRCIGLRIIDIYNLLKQTTDDSAEDLLAIIVSLWDCGKSAYSILEEKNEAGESIIAGFMRHGEQTFRALYDIYSNIYILFYIFYRRTHEIQKSQIVKFAQYCNKFYGVNTFTDFISRVDYEHYFSDLIAIKPAMDKCISSDPYKDVETYVMEKYNPT